MSFLLQVAIQAQLNIAKAIPLLCEKAGIRPQTRASVVGNGPAYSISSRASIVGSPFKCPSPLRERSRHDHRRIRTDFCGSRGTNGRNVSCVRRGRSADGGDDDDNIRLCCGRVACRKCPQTTHLDHTGNSNCSKELLTTTLLHASWTRFQFVSCMRSLFLTCVSATSAD